MARATGDMTAARAALLTSRSPRSAATMSATEAYAGACRSMAAWALSRKQGAAWPRRVGDGDLRRHQRYSARWRTLGRKTMDGGEAAFRLIGDRGSSCRRAPNCKTFRPMSGTPPRHCARAPRRCLPCPHDRQRRRRALSARLCPCPWRIITRPPRWPIRRAWLWPAS